jgi:hypothetical protein
MEKVTTKKRRADPTLLHNKFIIYFNTGGLIKWMGNLNSAFEKADSQWKQIFGKWIQ